MNTVEVLGCVLGVSIGSYLDSHTRLFRSTYTHIKISLCLSAKIWGGGGEMTTTIARVPT